MRDTNIEVAPEYEKCTLVEALISDMDFEFEVYTHDKTKCDAYKTELDTYKASLEVYKVTSDFSPDATDESMSMITCGLKGVVAALEEIGDP